MTTKARERLNQEWTQLINCLNEAGVDTPAILQMVAQIVIGEREEFEGRNIREQRVTEGTQMI